MLLKEIGPNMAAAPLDPQSFWEFLDSFDGDRMWEGIGYGKGLTWERAYSTTETDHMT